MPDPCAASCGDLKAMRSAEVFDDVLVPREPEARTQERRDRAGISLPAVPVEALTTLSDEVRVPIAALPAG